MNVQKLTAESGYLSAILTIRENKQPFSQFLPKCSFHRNQISTRVNTDTKDSKYHKMFWGNYIMAMAVEQI